MLVDFAHAPQSYLLPFTFPRGAIPTRRVYTLTVQRGLIAPDGYAKEAYMINGQMPGPIIEANEGDTLEITVRNAAGDGSTTSMHWHGIRQNGTQDMDGVPGFSQCPLRDGQSQTYVFDTRGQRGTFWYHSHSSSQLSDGVAGPLIIHPSRGTKGTIEDVAAEFVIFVQDWYHDKAEDISRALLTTAGYHGIQAAPAPMSNLINGRGVFRCERLGPKRLNATCLTPQPPALVVPRGLVRFRFINGGSHAEQLISLDTQMLNIISADGTLIKPQTVHRIPFSSGQRYDVIVEFSHINPGDGMWLRVEVDNRCFAIPEPLLDPVARMAIYVDHLSLKPPATQAWEKSLPSCKDLDETTMLFSAGDETIPEFVPPAGVFIFNSVLGNLQATGGKTLARFQFNGTTYIDHAYEPFLRTLSQGKDLPASDVSVVTIPDDIWTADIIINNLDKAITHPYHLHGMDFAIVKRGDGRMTYDDYEKELKSGALSTRLLPNPLRRDTLTIHKDSYAVLRLDASVKGVWPLHCHIAWHLTQGFMAAVVIHPHAIAQFPNKIWTQSTQQQCLSDVAAGASTSEVQPPRRRQHDMRWRHARQRRRKYAHHAF